MISEEVQLRLMTYFFQQTVSDPLYTEFHELITEAMFDSQDTRTDDELVSIGVEIINQYVSQCE